MANVGSDRTELKVTYRSCAPLLPPSSIVKSDRFDRRRVLWIWGSISVNGRNVSGG